METLKWVILLATVPAIFCEYSAQHSSRAASLGPCDQTHPCKITNSVCSIINGCNCRPGYTVDESRAKCSKVLAKDCEGNGDCDIEDSFCNKMKKCACKAGYFELDDQCAAGINGFCMKDEECKVKNTECPKRVYSCRCKIDFTPNSDSTECLPKLAENCTTSEECLAYKSHCKNGTCKCLPGHLYVEGSCVPKIGADCENDKDCSILGSTCENKKCACEENYFELDRKCVKGLNAECKESDECKSKFSVCLGSNNTCQCLPDYKPTSDHKCLAQMGDKCDVSADCLEPNTRCANGRCECLPGYSQIEGKCVLRVGAYCEKKSDCVIPNSQCRYKKCECDEHYTGLDDKCLTGVGAYCLKNDDCQTNHTVCSFHSCSCDSGYVGTPDYRCLPNKLPEKCAGSQECPHPNSQCKDGSCQCLPGRSFDEWQCVHRLGTYCEEHTDCGIPESDCQENECTCRESYFELDGQCARGVNASCYDNKDCKASNSVCSTESGLYECRCEPNFVDTPDYKCLPISQHHKECTYDSQCSTALAHTSCNDTEEGRRCECTGRYFFKESECYPKRYVNDTCNRWDECFTESSYCRNGVCACLPDFPNFHDNKCNNSSAIARSIFSLIAMIVLASKALL